MKQAGVRGALVVAITGMMLAGYQNCSQTKFDGTGTDRTNASLSSTDGKDPNLGGGTVTDNPKPTIDVGLGPYDPGVMNGGAQLCVHQIKMIKPRMNQAKNLGTEEIVARTVPNGFGGASVLLVGARSVAQDLGDVPLAVSPQGTLIASVPFPVGQYEEVQLSLRPGCGGGSASFTNTAGKSISVADATTLRFKGAFNVTAANPQLALNVQPLMVALAKAKDAKEAREALDNGCADY